MSISIVDRGKLPLPKRPWRASEKDPQCIVSDDWGDEDDFPGIDRVQEEEWYGGRFICESVSGELRDFIIRAVNAYEGE